jgi:hypothetical protein
MEAIDERRATSCGCRTPGFRFTDADGDHFTFCAQSGSSWA